MMKKYVSLPSMMIFNSDLKWWVYNRMTKLFGSIGHRDLFYGDEKKEDYFCIFCQVLSEHPQVVNQESLTNA